MRYGLGLSDELLFINIAQRATKLWPFKVTGPKKKSHSSQASQIYLTELASNPKCQIIFKPPNFCSPLTCALMMHSSPFESSKPYLFGHFLKTSIIELLRYVILAQSNLINAAQPGIRPFSKKGFFIQKPFGL